MIVIYSDKNLLNPVEGNILFEGQNYYLNVENYSKERLDKWLEEEYILPAIANYHPKNKILQLRFDNIVGYINILDTKYDVRSKKLFDNVDGNTQFQKLLDEVNAISKKLTFNFTGTSYAQRKSEYEYNLNDLEVFDYYYQLAFTYPKTTNLETLINQCINYPNTTNVESFQVLGIEKSKKIVPAFFKKLGSQSNYGQISDHHFLANSAFAKMTYHKIQKRLLPLTAINSQLTSSTNTIENRFLKFFLEEINSICLRIINSRFDENIKSKAGKLQTRIHQFLLLPFFKNIQRLTFIPASSAVLIKKTGYNEIYYHFIQSKFNFRPILDSQKKEAHKAGLKNIATLYEMWVFFEIALLLFEKEIVHETFNGQTLKNGSLIGTYTWETGNYQLFFNKSYTKGNKDSYSVTLRPDVSLLIDGKKLFLFDAKYKFNSSNEDAEALTRIVKAEDIHKMHAYLDAIPAAKASVVIYPGTEPVFHHKLTTDTPILSLDGVGAFPLTPSNRDSLKDIIELIKSTL